MRRTTLTTLLVVVLVATGGVAGTAGATFGSGQTTGSIDTQTTRTAQQTLTNHTGVTLDNQTSGGYTVTVQNVTLPDGGFVVLHDESLGEGAVLGSVVGASSYLSPGTHENVTVRLESPLSNTSTLTAMAHRDTDGDRIYEFVSSNGTADGPYTGMDGNLVVDPGTITVSATVNISTQPTDNGSVVVDRVELSEPGFVVIHNQSLLTEGDAVGSVVGSSGLLSAGVHENVRITLDQPVSNETIVAMPHRDTNDNQAYDFPGADGPFRNAGGQAVVDPARVTVQSTASVTFDAQTSGGTVFTVDSVFLPEGGYVVLHDERLAEGEAVASVRGNSSYLEPGLHRNVRIVLNESVENATTLTAMAHRETNGNELYEFPDEDGPYTDAGGAVVDAGNVSVSASVSASTQTSDGRTVVIDSVDLAEGGFVVIHDASLFAGDVTGSVLGSSQYLEAGYHEDVTVTLDTAANESQTLVAMAHRDTNGNQAYDFLEQEGGAD
ncbi:MAG: PGF-CTERM sorting domain-containing protein, partial [Halobaculum sp.]